MARRDAPTPTPVGTLLTAALPPLADRLLALAVRRDWPSLVGPQIARRAQPGGIAGGTLAVVVDNSPWLQELRLREAELLSRLQDRYGAQSIKALRFTLGTPSPEARPAGHSEPPGDEALSDNEAAWVARATAAVPDPALADTLRRLLVKDLVARRRAGGPP